ncbi:MAG: truncated hemoglobin YjbI [bacterium]|jgi:truncated hemoglobin YjbI
MSKSDITTREDITTLIHTFYAEVREDDLLVPNF